MITQIKDTDYTDLKDNIVSVFEESVSVKKGLCNNKYLNKIIELAEAIVEAIRADGKVILFGNGGSAADAQHIAGELIGRFRNERNALPAISLTTDTSVITCIGNDYGFDNIFARQIESLGKREDIAIGISTSGNSPNVLKAIKAARAKGLKTAGLTGARGGRLDKMADIVIAVPSKDTPRIQEAHITIGHILCEIVEERLSH